MAEGLLMSRHLTGRDYREELIWTRSRFLAQEIFRMRQRAMRTRCAGGREGMRFIVCHCYLYVLLGFDLMNLPSGDYQIWRYITTNYLSKRNLNKRKHR